MVDIVDNDVFYFQFGKNGMKVYKYHVPVEDRKSTLEELYKNRKTRINDCKIYLEFVLSNVTIEHDTIWITKAMNRILSQFNDKNYIGSIAALYKLVKLLEKKNIL